MKDINNPLMDFLANNPQFTEIAKVMRAYENSIPIRVNGELRRITTLEYTMNPYTNAWVFKWNDSEWEGEYCEIIDVDMALLKDTKDGK